jgi:hypothetical protein
MTRIVLVLFLAAAFATGLNTAHASDSAITSDPAEQRVAVQTERQASPAPFRTRIQDGQIMLQTRTGIEGSFACVCQGEGRCPIASIEPADQSLTCQQTSGPSGCNSTCKLEVTIGGTTVNPAQTQTPSGH